MISFSRTNNSIFGRWWWTVDRPMLFAFFLMIAFGILMAMAATPMVAARIGIEKFYFLKRHLLYIIPSLMIMFSVSILDNRNLKKFALVLYLISIFLIFMTLIFGMEIKGARRWISLLGFSIQPSEFAKPALIIITAWMFSKQQKEPEFPGKIVAFVFYLVVALLLVLQPDIGMLVVVSGVWFGMLFLNGLPIIYLVGLLIFGLSGFVLAYLFLPHVTARVDKFLDPSAGDHYQITKSLDAFSAGGLFGVGPGEGIVKKNLPDAHADFVFSVLGEEFGFFVCVLLVILVAFIVIYGMIRLLKDSNLFSIFATTGLLAQFGLQSFINMASSLHLIPTKGMTLPFISYGGSSMFAISITAGMILALGRKKSIGSSD